MRFYCTSSSEFHRCKGINGSGKADPKNIAGMRIGQAQKYYLRYFVIKLKVATMTQLKLTTYSITSQTRSSKLAKFSNSRFLLLFFTSKLAVPILSTQIRDFCYFLSPKNREFGGITVYNFVFAQGDQKLSATIEM